MKFKDCIKLIEQKILNLYPKIQIKIEEVFEYGYEVYILIDEDTYRNDFTRYGALLTSINKEIVWKYDFYNIYFAYYEKNDTDLKTIQEYLSQ